MKQINTTNWKVFRVGDLFPSIKKPKVYHTREVVEDNLGIPYVVRSKFNNGIKCRIKPEGLELSPKGVITFGAENAAFFYQEEEWCGGRDIYYIDTRNIHPFACLFLAACLNQITGKYSYNFGLFPDLLRKEKIRLPYTCDGSPDWQYIEEYMRRIEQRTQTAISAFVSSKYSSRKIDTTYWKEFSVGTFFDFQRGKVKKLQTLEKGAVPVIAAARSKQGVAGYYAVEPIYKDQITISCNGVGCGSTFYHNYPFNVNGDAIVSTDKIYIPEKAKQFICCILDGVLTRKYSYEEKCSPEKASNEVILLPATPAGEPDWHYMEMYMRGVEAITKEKISLLTRKKQEPVQGSTINNYGTVNIYEK